MDKILASKNLTLEEKQAKLGELYQSEQEQINHIFYSKVAKMKGMTNYAERAVA